MRDPRLLMLDLLPTYDLEDVLGAAVERDERRQTVETQRAVAMAERRLALARRRDEIQSGRPDGCWCLGLGGRSPSYLPSTDEVPDPVPQIVYREYCDACIDGIERRTRDAAILAHSFERRRADRLYSFLSDPLLDDYQAAHFPLGGIAAANQPALAMAERWLRDGQRNTFLLVGSVGTGKTHLSVATARAWLEAHDASIWFVSFTHFLQQIKATYETGSDERTSLVVARACTVGLLIWDGIGDDCYAELSEHDRAKAMEVVDARSRARLPMICSTNLSSAIPRGDDRFPSPIERYLGERLLSRLIGSCGGTKAAGGYIAEMTGTDRRMKGWAS